MTYRPDDFSGFGSLDVGNSAEQVTHATVEILRTSLGFMDSEGRSPTNRESLDVLSAIDAIRSGDPFAARMFAHRALSFSERRATPRTDEQRLYTTAQLRSQLDGALLAAGRAPVADPPAR